MSDTGPALSHEEVWEEGRALGEQIAPDVPEPRTQAHDDYLAQGDNRTIEPRTTNVASTTTSDVAGGGAYDPGGYTIAEVQQYITDNPDQLDAVRSAEESGKNRTTLMDWFSTQ